MSDYLKRLALALDLPEGASWDDCIARAGLLSDKRNTLCEHEWMARGTPDDKWWECFYCGGIAD